MVWLIPIFGAVLVQAMMRSDGKPRYKPKKGVLNLEIMPRDGLGIQIAV